MSTIVMNEIQSNINQLLIEKPDLKTYVQQNVRDHMQKKPAKFKDINELLEWKISVWEVQYTHDLRIQYLFDKLSVDERDNFYETIILNPYIPTVPFFNQILLICSNGSALYGGARGGGKSEANLMGALQYVEFPDWKAGIFRLTFKDLSVPGAIMDRCLKWVHKNILLEDAGLSPHWDRDAKILTFPSSAQIMFGHMQHDSDADNYQGSEFHHLDVDEAVQFTENKITRLKGSNRKQFHDPLPIRRWYTGNPGGLSHEYFKTRFVDGDYLFINSNYLDNPYLDQEKYNADVFEEIKDSDPLLYRQWKYGDWEAVPEGLMFKRPWFKTYSHINEKIVKRVRWWDMAATKEEDPNKKGGPDWTSGTLMLLGESGKTYIEDIVRFRLDPDETEEMILTVAKEDSFKVILRVEQEGGSGSKMYMNTLGRLLPGYDFEGKTSTGSKIDRAKTMVSAVKNGNLLVKEGTQWLPTFINEICSFPTKGIHDDQVDSTSGAFIEIHNLKVGNNYENIDYDKFIEWNY